MMQTVESPAELQLTHYTINRLQHVYLCRDYKIHSGTISASKLRNKTQQSHME